MKYIQRSSWRWLGRKLRTQFLAGILTVVPIGATILILVWIFNTIDSILHLQPLIEGILGRPVPGVGFGITILLIYLVGVIVSNVLGRRLLHYGESLVTRIPMVRQLYTGIKQILESFSTPSKTGFMQVVLVEFPRKGMRTLGFVTNESTDKSGKKLLNIFIPTAPNPTSGFLQIARESEVIRTDISVDDALKMVISAGRVSVKEIAEQFPEKD